MFAAQPALTVVGTGIQIGRDLTASARSSIQHADKVFFLVADLVAAAIVKDLNPTAESLHVLYEYGKPRSTTYQRIVDRILDEVRRGSRVTVVAYGHPGVFASAAHAAIECARREGFEALMLPAVSAVDCLIADLGVDPGTRGFQMFDASDFVRRAHNSFDPSTDLVLLQISLINEVNYRTESNPVGLQSLVDQLIKSYGPEYPAIIYQASGHAICGASIQRMPIRALASASVGLGSTLYVRGKGEATPQAERLRGQRASRTEVHTG